MDRPSISVEEEAEITVSVSGSFGSSDPVAPNVSGLDIVQTGKNSQVQFINGNVSMVTEFTFTVVPAGEGEYAIPPFIVYSGGVEYKSNSLKLSVQKGGGYSSRPNPGLGSPFAPQGPSGQPVYPDDGGGDPFWITATVSNTSPKIYEQVIFRFRLYARESADIIEVKLPSFDDFMAEELVPEKKGREVVSGVTYNTYDIVYALFPLRAGEIRIDETRLKLRHYPPGGGRSRLFDQFFNDPLFNSPMFNNRRAKPRDLVLKAPPVAVKVEDLPQPVPDDFTNLVGKFGVSSEFSDDSIAQGDSFTYTVRISGRGNVKDAVLPEIVFPGAKTYPDKPVVETQKAESGISGGKTFKLAIVPSNAGEFVVPQVTLSYFDPSSGRYEQLKLDEHRVAVAPSAAQNTNTAFADQGQVSQNADEGDLAPLVADASIALRPDSPMLPRGVFMAFAFGLPAIVVLLGVLRFVTSLGAPRLRELRQKKSDLSRLHKLLGAADAAEKDILEGLRACFSALAGGSGRALTAAEMAKLCAERGVSEGDSSELRSLAEQLEAAQYGFAAAAFTPDMRRKLSELMRRLARRLETGGGA